MRLNTTRAKQSSKKILQKLRLRYLGYKDIQRFSKTAAFSVFDDDYEQVVSRIMYNVHALEKGLARNVDRRLGFGIKALSNLSDAMVVYRSRGYDENLFAYVEGVSVIQRYLELHEREEHDLGHLLDVISPDLLQPDAKEATSCMAGVKMICKADKRDNSSKSFYDLAQGRSSVRDFSGRPIDSSKVMAAIRNAEKTPSVCNRQGWRVYWVEDAEIARQVLVHQRGFGYPQMPAVLLTITVSNNTYLSPVERNQAYVDGGLFAMSVLYGLEYEGLAAVPLNAMMYYRDQEAVRELLKIDESEVFIMFIAVGDFMDECLVPVSDRKSLHGFVRMR